MIVYCLALVAASLMPVVVGGAGPVYLAGALLLGIGLPGVRDRLFAAAFHCAGARCCGRR